MMLGKDLRKKVKGVRRVWGSMNRRGFRETRNNGPSKEGGETDFFEASPEKGWKDAEPRIIIQTPIDLFCSDSD